MLSAAKRHTALWWQEETCAGEQEAVESIVKVGKIVHVPHSAFPGEAAPENGYWLGKTCKTKKGGTKDIGIRIEGEEIFTRPMEEVAGWLESELA